MMVDDANRRALARILRYIVVPALRVGMDAIRGYLEAGTLAVDWRVVAIASITAALAGASKWIRDLFEVDLKVI